MAEMIGWEYTGAGSPGRDEAHAQFVGRPPGRCETCGDAPSTRGVEGEHYGAGKYVFTLHEVCSSDECAPRLKSLTVIYVVEDGRWVAVPAER